MRTKRERKIWTQVIESTSLNSLKKFCFGLLQKDTSVGPSSANYHQCVPLSSEIRCEQKSKSMVSCPGRCVPVKEFCKQAKAEIEETTEKLKFYYRTFKRANGILQKKKLNNSLKIGDIKLKKRVEHLKNQLNKYAGLYSLWKKFSPFLHQCPDGESMHKVLFSTSKIYVQISVQLLADAWALEFI